MGLSMDGVRLPSRATGLRVSDDPNKMSRGPGIFGFSGGIRNIILFWQASEHRLGDGCAVFFTYALKIDLFYWHSLLREIKLVADLDFTTRELVRII